MVPLPSPSDDLDLPLVASSPPAAAAAVLSSPADGFWRSVVAAEPSAAPAIADTAAQAVLDAVLALAAARSANAEARSVRPPTPGAPPKDATTLTVDRFLSSPMARMFAAPADGALDGPLGDDEGDSDLADLEAEFGL